MKGNQQYLAGLTNRALVIEQHALGLCSKEIAGILDLHYTTVILHLRKAGLKSNFVVERHGHTRQGLQTSEYQAWRNMKARCNNLNHPDFYNYGARGIKVCKEWNESFTAFFDAIGSKPAPEYTLDRRNNRKGYSPDNCIWSTRQDQANNRRKRRSHAGRMKAMLKSNYWANNGQLVAA